MTEKVGLPAGYDPGRLPGYPLGGDFWLNWYDGQQPAGVPVSCAGNPCPVESDPGPWTPEPGPAPEGGGGSSTGPTAALRRASALLGIAERVGVTLPAITAPEGCSGSGVCSGWLNLDGSLAMQVSAGQTCEPFSQGICLTRNNLTVPSTPEEFGHWMASVNPKFDEVNKTLTNPIGTEFPYSGSPSAGQYYTAPEGAQNRLKKVSGGFEEYQPNGLKRIYETDDSIGLLTGWTANAGTWTLTRVDTRITSIEDPAGRRTTLAYDDVAYPSDPRLTTLTDSAGRETVFTYDSSNRNHLIKVTTPEQCVTSFSYDNDRLQEWTTPSGLITTFSYDDDGRLEEIERPDGRTTITYSGNAMEIRDARGNRTTYIKDSTNSGQLQAQVNALGERTTYTWESGWPKSIQDGRGYIYTFTYQSLSGDTNIKRLQEIESPGGNRFTYLMDTGSGQLTTITDERGNTSTLTWSSGRISSYTNASSQRTTFAYSTQYHQLETVTQPTGSKWTFTYDSTGRKTEDRDPLSNRTTYTYSTAGCVETRKNPLGKVTDFTYDDMNRLETVEDPLEHTTSYHYGSDGLLESVTDPAGEITSYSYDGNGRLESVTDPLSHRTSYSYDAMGNRTEVWNAENERTTSAYDALNRLATLTNGLGKQTTYTYDASGNLEETTDALGHTTTTQYDNENRLQVVVDPAGNRTTYSYDASGNQTSVRNPLGQRTTMHYDALNRLEAVEDAYGRRTTYTYDAASRQRSVKDALDKVTTFTHDAAGRLRAIEDARGKVKTLTYDDAGQLTEETDPLGQIVTYTYDDAGQLESREDAREITTSYSYDEVGRLTKRSYTNDTRVSFTYDEVGNPTAIDDGIGRWTMTYDDVYRLKTQTDPANKRLTYTYDDAGQRTGIFLPTGGLFGYGYYDDGRVEVVVNPETDRTTLTYDEAGRLTKRELANGTVASMSYDAADQVTVLENLYGATAPSRYTYSYDNVGNRTEVQEGGSRVVTWTYDETYRLQTEKRSGTGGFETTYTYDAVGNRTVQEKDGARTSSTYDAANQLVTVVNSSGTTTYTYDEAGNLTLEHAPGNTRTSYSWDDENRNTKLTIPGGGITTMAYRHDGLRVRKETASATTKFIYDGQNYLLETDGSDSVKRVLTNEPMGYGNLISQRFLVSGSTWGTVWHHYDALGSTRQITNVSAQVGNSYGYTAWGEAISALTSVILPNSFRWIGMLGYYFDDEADTYYVRARHYDPTTGRWVAKYKAGVQYGVFPGGWLPYDSAAPKPQPSSGFKLCTRAVINRPDHKCEQACNIAHQYIQFGEVNESGKPLPGTQGVGIGAGGMEGDLPGKEEKFQPFRCCNYRRKSTGTSATGKPCSQASRADIWHCVSTWKLTQNYKKLKYDCTDWAKEASEACCLTGCMQPWFEYLHEGWQNFSGPGVNPFTFGR